MEDLQLSAGEGEDEGNIGLEEQDSFDRKGFYIHFYNFINYLTAENLPQWYSLGLRSAILQRLHDQGFTSPTPIQRDTLPLSLSGRDVIGISQTGSGKTLAFALPIINYILSLPTPSKKCARSLKALIVAPTRELALQVAAHINACSPQRTEAQVKAHAAPRISVATIVGGMSMQKQERMLEKGADIIVATPGRLWEMLSGVGDIPEPFC